MHETSNVFSFYPSISPLAQFHSANNTFHTTHTQTHTSEDKFPLFLLMLHPLLLSHNAAVKVLSLSLSFRPIKNNFSKRKSFFFEKIKKKKKRGTEEMFLWHWTSWFDRIKKFLLSVYILMGCIS
jgi:hypothetical protein